MFGNKTFTFGTPATTSASTTTGLFGSPATATSTASLQNTTFSFGNKPTTTSSSTPSLFGTTSFGGFGSQPTATTSTASPFSGFGATTTTTSTPSFTLGSLTTSAPTTGLSFGTTANTSSAPLAGSLFGTGTQPQQQQQQQQVGEVDRLTNALVYPQVFNDERDLVLAKWNQLQAFYGTGKIFYQNQAIDIKEDNPLTRFKTVGYSVKPQHKNEDGLVVCVLNKKEQDVKTNEKSISDSLIKVFAASPSFSLVVDSIRPLMNDKTEFIFYIIEKSPSGQTRRIPSYDVFNYLNKQDPSPSLTTLKTTTSIKTQLESIGIISVYPLVTFNEEQIKQYLDTPPVGLNPILWEQAKKNNPNSNKLLPIPIIGFNEMHNRFILQDKENQAQKTRLHLIGEDINRINDRNKLLMNKIEQLKSKNEEYEHRVLKLMINTEIRRKLGYGFQEDEKYLRSILESLQIELASPINKEIRKQKLNEYVEIIKLYEQQQQQQQHSFSDQTSQFYGSIDEMHKSLKEQHKAFKSLIEIINKDLHDIEIIKKDMSSA